MRYLLETYIHNLWGEWLLELFSNCYKNDNGDMVVPKYLVEKWLQQENTSYSDLLETEKYQCKVQANKIINIIINEVVK